MTDEQFQELRQMILNLAVEIESIKLHLKKQDRDADARQSGLVNSFSAALDMVSDEDDDFPTLQN